MKQLLPPRIFEPQIKADQTGSGKGKIDWTLIFMINADQEQSDFTGIKGIQGIKPTAKNTSSLILEPKKRF